METAFETFDLLRNMASNGNPASVTDAGVGTLAARAAVRGAFLNVKINASGLKDRAKADALIARGSEIEEKAAKAEAEILDVVNSKDLTFIRQSKYGRQSKGCRPYLFSHRP